MISENVKKLMESKGNLPSYANVGGYPLYYITDYCNVFCSNCAKTIINCEYETIIDFVINWEGELYCEDCGNVIESAYEVIID